MEKYKKIYKGDVEITKIFVGNDKVWPSGIPITGLTITGETEVGTGSSLQLDIEYTPSNTTEVGVTWSSSDETKATVDSNGLVTAISPGTVVITATSTINGAVSDTHNVTISNLYAVIKPLVSLPTGVTYGLHEHNGWKYSVSRGITAGAPENVFYWNDGSVAGKVLRATAEEIKAILGNNYFQYGFTGGISATLPADKWYPDLFYNAFILTSRNISTSGSIPPFGANGYKISNMSAGTYKVKIWDVNNNTVSAASRYNINGISVTPFTGNRSNASSPNVHGKSTTKPELKEATVTIGAGQDINIMTHMSYGSSWNTYGPSLAAIEIEKVS